MIKTRQNHLLNRNVAAECASSGGFRKKQNICGGLSAENKSLLTHESGVKLKTASQRTHVQHSNFHSQQPNKPSNFTTERKLEIWNETLLKTLSPTSTAASANVGN